MPDGHSNQIVILHISDLHFGQHDPNKVKAILGMTKEHQPDIICITGDIVNFPRNKYFIQARNFIQELKNHCNNIFCTPGNHDALFGLNKYKKFIQYDVEYWNSVTIKEKEISIFSINTTTKNLYHFNNSGYFSYQSQQRFKKHLNQAKKTLGSSKFERSYKIVLLHHHPLPTLTSKYEKVLYFKDSGKFLHIAGNELIDLVLHGHQHDPCYYSINFNAAHEEESMIILSAGSATKKVNEDRNISATSQVHVVKIHPEQTLVESHNYDYASDSFFITRLIPKDHKISPVDWLKDEQKYYCFDNGDLSTKHKRTLSAKHGHQISELPITFGVDARSISADFNDINFRLTRNGDVIPAKQYKLVDDKPHIKTILVKLHPPIKMKRETFEWEYCWPGGFLNLLKDGKDRGYWAMQERLDELSVEVELNCQHRMIKDFKVLYHDESKIELLYISDSKKRGFRITKPPYLQSVAFDLSVS
ncbi:MAG: metallophosphoesterase [Candidatus Thiodiazotropha sp.]|jgi:predicted phosphodiesterase